MKFCHKCGVQTLSDNAKYCTGCGIELQHEASQPISQKNTSVTKSAKKGFGIGVKIGLGVGVIFFLIIIIGAIGGSSHNTEPNTNNQQPTTLQEQSSSSNDKSVSPNNSSPDKSNGEPITADQMISFVQNYRGPNDNGPMLESILTNYITDNFGNGPTGLGEAMATEQWLALKPTNSFGLWKVEHIMDIQKNIYIWEWDVNTINHKIYAVDQSAQAILNGVENP